MEYTELTENIKIWSIDKGLDATDPRKQMAKLMEEFGELCAGVNKSNTEVIIDSIGDMAVVMIIMAQQLEIENFDISETGLIINQHAGNLLFMTYLLGGLAQAIDNHDDRFPSERGVSADLHCVLYALHAFANYYHLDFKDCLEYAWDEIAYRKGEMVNGVFVKEDDLKSKNEG